MSLTIDRDAFEDIMRTLRELKVCLDNKITENRKNNDLHKLELRSLTQQIESFRSDSVNAKGDSQADRQRNSRLSGENQTLRRELQQVKAGSQKSPNQERLTIVLKSQIDKLQTNNRELQSELRKSQDVYRSQSKELETFAQLKKSQAEIQSSRDRFLHETNDSLEGDNRHLKERLRENEEELRKFENTKTENNCLKLQSSQYELQVGNLRTVLTTRAKSEAAVSEKSAKKLESIVKEQGDLQKENQRLSKTLTDDCQKFKAEIVALQEQCLKLTEKVTSLKESKCDAERLRQLSDKQSVELDELRQRDKEHTSLEAIAKTSETDNVKLIKRVKSLKKSVSKLQGETVDCSNLRKDNDDLRTEVGQLHGLIDRQALVLRKDRHAYFDEEDSTVSIVDPEEVILPDKNAHDVPETDSDPESHLTPAEVSEPEHAPEKPAPYRDSWFDMLGRHQHERKCAAQQDEDLLSDDSLLAKKCENYLQKRKSVTRRDSERERAASVRFEPAATSTPVRPVSTKQVAEPVTCVARRPPSKGPVDDGHVVSNLRNTYTPSFKGNLKLTTPSPRVAKSPAPSAPRSRSKPRDRNARCGDDR